MPRRAAPTPAPTRADAGVVAPTWSSTTVTTIHELHPGAPAPPALTTPAVAASRPPVRGLVKSDTVSTSVPSASPAINVAPTASSPTSTPFDIFPALASLESALHISPTAVAQPLKDVLSSAAPILAATSLLSAPLALVTPLLSAATQPPSTGSLASPSTLSFVSSSASHFAVPSASRAATMSTAVHTSIVAVLITGGVIVSFFGGLAAWHSFRRSRRKRSSASPMFGGMTPRSFGPGDEKFPVGSWQTFEENEGIVPSASAANDLAHQHQPLPKSATNQFTNYATAAVDTPASVHAPKLRIRNADIGKPMRVGLGYETHSIHVPSGPAPSPPLPSPYMPMPQLPAHPLPVLTVASASQTSMRLAGSGSGGMTGVGSNSTLGAGQPISRQLSYRSTTQSERPLTERQTKVLTSALGLASPPSPTFDLDLYRYTRYGLEDAQSMYEPSPLPLQQPDASPNTALGQLLMDCEPTPVLPAQPQYQPQSQSSSEASLAPLPASYTQSSSSPGLPYLSSLEPLPIQPLKLARKGTGGGKKHRVKRASMLPRLDFPLPPATVPTRPQQKQQLDFWDEVVSDHPLIHNPHDKFPSFIS